MKEEKFLEELYRVYGLVERAETFINSATALSQLYEEGLQKTKNKHEYYTSPPVKLIVIQTNLFFQEALLCVHTVLFGNTKEDKQEIGIPFIVEKYKEQILKASPKYEIRFSLARKKFKYPEGKEGFSLFKMRHKLVAHKDLLTSGDPAASYLNRFHNVNINNLREVIKVLNGFFLSFDIPRNSGFEQYYASAFRSLEKMLSKELY